MCLDGPCLGASLTVERCPQTVQCTRSADGHFDILNEPEDQPRLDETAYWYRWDGNPPGFVCGRGVHFRTVTLVHAPELES
jgi:hypothetical protein